LIAIAWRQRALEDLLAIVDYIALDNPAAALALQQEIEAKVARLTLHPKL
jgi:toxin ParE1/3/4